LVFLKLKTPRTSFLDGIRAIDWLGVLTIVGGIIMFLYGIQSGGISHPWASAFTLCLIIFGGVSIAIFSLIEWKLARYPVMPLRIFSPWSNVASLGVCFIHGFVFIGGPFYLPLYFQTVLSATPTLSGVYLFPLVLSLGISSALTGVLINKTGRYRPPIWFGLASMTLGFGLFISLDPYANWPKIIIFQIIAGFGVGPNFQGPLIALQNHVKPHDIATATALFTFVRNVSSAMSVVLGGVVFQNLLAKKGPVLLAALGPKLAGLLASSSFASATGLLQTLPPSEKAIVDVVYTESLRWVWVFYTAVAACGIAVSLFVAKKELSREHHEVKTGIEEQEKVRKQLEEEKRRAKEEKSGARAKKDADVELGT
jgi:MFS family permease